MHEVNICLFKIQISDFSVGDQPSRVMQGGNPKRGGGRWGWQLSKGAVLPGVKGAVTLRLAPAPRCGSFSACVRLTGCVWHRRLCETHIRTEMFVKASMIDGLVKLEKFNTSFCFLSRGALPLPLPYRLYVYWQIEQCWRALPGAETQLFLLLNCYDGSWQGFDSSP